MTAPRKSLLTRFPRPERLLPFACIGGAGALFASEFMTTFQFAPPGGATLCTQQAADRHHFALGVLAIFAIGAVIVAVLSASKPAAIAVAVAGLLALLLFLIVDLPDANNIGTLDGACTSIPTQAFFDAKAEPQAGFWLEMVAALALALGGVMLATLSPDQLASLRPRRLGGPKGTAGPRPPASSRTPLSTTEPNPPPRANPDPSEDRPARARRPRR